MELELYLCTIKDLMGAKNGKSPGIDLIQAEECKNQIVIYVLYKLFNLCIKTGKVPSIWNRGIITPIPKCHFFLVSIIEVIVFI
jgi:hypothetical protein